MKLTMLETRTGSEDGIHINTYHVGATYDFGTDLGSVFVREGWAQAPPLVPETKPAAIPEKKRGRPRKVK